MAVATASIAILLSGIYVNSTDVHEYASKLPILFVLSSVIIATVALSRYAGLIETFKGVRREIKSIATDN